MDGLIIKNISDLYTVRCNNEKTIFVNPNINIKDNICE